MATMVKEKSKDKKKSKDKNKSKKLIEQEFSIEEAETSIPNTKLEESQTVSPEAVITPNKILEETQITTEAAEANDKGDIKIENTNLEDKTTLAVDTIIKTDVLKLNEIKSEIEKVNEKILPSAPVFIESEPVQYIVVERVQEEVRTRAKCMPLEEAVRLFGGKEIAEIRGISEKEEAIVEAGPQSKPDHPLIDLLSTFRTSLISVDRERNRISCRYVEEDKSRITLWKVEKRTIIVSEKCACGTIVNLRANFDVAELDRERLSAARLRLQALLQDVQDSYCHYQHTALQTHCEIDEVVSETIKQEKECIREALALVFDALRFSDGAPAAYAQALQRWASILSTALLEEENYSHLFFVLHNLFRQTRSVQWAGQVLRLQVKDMSSAARLLGLLELLLTRTVLESAQECTEDSEAWEELDDRGEGCAVGEGRLRERDLLALLKALPLRDLLARLTLFSRQDISTQSEEWWGDASGGHGVLKACCGVRATLLVLQRARDTHAGYARLLASLRRLALAALDALAALHEHSRSSYSSDLEARITPELAACFAAGFSLLGDETHRLPATLLSEDVVKDYCNTLIVGLHEKSVHISSLSVDACEQSCGLRTRTITQASISRPLDRDLARTVLDFLFQTGIHRRPPCKGACDVTARELLPQVLAVHPHVHTAAFHLLADSHQMEADRSILEPLFLKHWRPTPTEIIGVLDDWAIRCPQLLQHLLLNLDYTPHTGVSLDSQQAVGEWVCGWAERRGAEPEWAWLVLRALRLHRAHWRLPHHAPTHPAPTRPLQMAFALLAGDWGHSVPLACGPGADALLQLAQRRPLDALHCAGLVLRVMAQSPESISLTPKFTEIFATILNSGPSLVQRALGQRGSGAELLQKLVLEQMRDPEIAQPERSALVSAWLHALWKPALPAAARGALDAALRAARDWRALDVHAAGLLQEENAKDYIADAVRNVSVAPLLCEALLRSAHAAELGSLLCARLLDELAGQQAAARRIHVDNALKHIGSNLCDDELSIHRCACAALSARAEHPAHALLWRLLLHMWLQRRSETAPPAGPLFFSGIVKSRTLAQLKKRLQETASYHHNQLDVLKAINSGTSAAVTQNKVTKSDSTTDNSLFQTLSILADLTGESIPESAQSDEDSKIEAISVNETKIERDVLNLISYHTGAEKMVREYLVWLEEGEAVRAYPHHADIARFVSEQALDAAWRGSLGPAAPAPPAAPPAPPPPAHRTQFERAVAAVTSVEDTLRKRYKIPAPPISISDSVLKDPFLLLEMIEKYIDELKKLNDQWQSECGRAAQLDSQLWELVEAQRVRRALPPVRGACPQRCEPLVVHVPEDEWCISTGAEQALRENRRSARAALRRLSRPRAYAARVTTALHSMARRVSSAASAERVADLAWRAAPRAEAYAPARDTLSTLVTDLAQRWLAHDSALACKLLRRWSGGSAAQQQLCGALVRPARLAPAHWPRLYGAVLALPLPPHAVFSYLSKFDMTHWADVVDTSARSEVLESLIKAAMKIGPAPEEQDLVLLELLGVHSAAVAREREVCAHVQRCARACAACSLPPSYAAHVPRLAHRARELHLDQIGLLLQDIGLIWWEARSSSRNDRSLYASYAPHFADTLYSLLKEFVAAAVRATYAPERVAYCSWSALEVSWSPWVVPHKTPPLLAPTGDEYGDMLTRFVDTIHMIMEDCPGSSEALLRQVWQWAARAALSEARAAPGLLARLAALPWRARWLQADCVPAALQLCSVADAESRSWFGEFVRHASRECWPRGAAREQLAPALAALLALFTAARPLVPPQALEEACELPWQHLPLAALDAALSQYFADHHNPALPYHQLPHFKVVLVAAGLALREADGGAGAHKRALCVSQWVRALCAPALAAHVRDHTLCLLNTITDLAPFVDPDELVELLSRALAVLCVQPADALALPVWEQCARSCGRDVRRALAAAAAALTTLDCFASLGDAVALAVMNETEPADWSEVSSRWSSGACGAWRAGALAARARLHAAYALLLAHAHSEDDLQHAFRALATADIDFVQNEAIVSVWICVAGRSVRRGGAARALLAGWAERRRTLLQLVALQSAAGCPTAAHQLLCRLALCAAPGGAGAARAYEAARGAVAAAADASFSARELRARSLPRLAARLLPGREHYFAHELRLAPDTDAHSQTLD